MQESGDPETLKQSIINWVEKMKESRQWRVDNKIWAPSRILRERIYENPLYIQLNKYGHEIKPETEEMGF
jgi:hypothetical protein